MNGVVGEFNDHQLRMPPVRWIAPELLYPENFGFTRRVWKLPFSKDTDIYAIGMTILEVSARPCSSETPISPFGQVITGRVPFASVPKYAVLLKLVGGDRPDRPPSGFSEPLWDLLVATWVERYAQKPCERPSASAVLIRLKECVDHWGKSITPPIPEDGEDTGSCRMSPDDRGNLFMSLL